MIDSWLRNKVQARLAAKGVGATVAPLARATGLLPQSLSAMLDNPDSIKAGNLSKLSAVLGVSLEWLRNGRTDDACDDLDSVDMAALATETDDTASKQT